MTRYTYEELAVPATRYGACPVCGKKTKRSRTFTQTVNPWNAIGEGGKKRPKTPSEVWASVHEEAIAWSPEPEVFRHAKCEPA